MSGLHLVLAAAFAAAAATPLIWRIDARLARGVAVLVPAAMTAYFVALAPAVLDGRPERASVPWAPSLGLHVALSVDGLGLLFAVLVCGIGSLVVLYAGTYLDGHVQHPRFTAILLLFLGSMLGLVLADDLYLLYVFWGLTGLSSWLLIGFNHEKQVARDGAGQAFLVTMAGELAMLAGFVLLAGIAGTTRISELAAAGETIRTDPIYPVVLALVLAGAITKSAQVPFHFWLPNAMEAPTPVSAYLHSATMVKAGIYLLARLAPVLAATDAWTVGLTAVGGATLLVGAWMSLGQTDLKRILAYSTVAALGMMVLLLGLDTPAATVAAVTVLLAHAGYKGALFLVAGALDHETGTRDVTRLGGLWRAMPVTAAAGIVAAASMVGLPAFLGFVSKELAYKATIGLDAFAVPLTAVLVVGSVTFVVAACVTGMRPFLGRAGAPPRVPHEAPFALWLGPAVLATLGLAAGIAPGVLAGPLVTAAAGDIAGVRVEAELLPIYPIDAALVLSVVTIIAGVALFAIRTPVRRLVGRLDPGPRRGAEGAWNGLVAATVALAAVSTTAIQSGPLRRYILIIVLTATALAWLVLAISGGMPAIAPSTDLRFWEIGVAGGILVGALVAVLTNSRLSAIAALGVVGYGIALVYLLFGAPDLAMTQILIETLTIILFVLVFYHLPRFATFPDRRGRIRDAAIALAAGGLMAGLVLSASVRPHDPISGFFVLASAPEALGRNIVNVILVDFRALDTLGEVGVLSLAGIGVFALLKLRAQRGAGSRSDP